MKRLKDELSIIGPKARMIVFLVWLALTAAMFGLWTLEPDGPPLMAKIWLSIGIPLPLTAYTAMVAYVHADAQRRAMRHVMWTLLAALIPNAIGIVLYFILRDPLAGNCLACGAAGRGNYAFCPGCGASLGTVCPQCHRPVEAGWRACAFCGGKL